MKLSHSKLNTILNDPISYYLGYVQGISLKEKKPALAIGSAVHWGIEHNTDDLTEYFKKEGTFRQRDNYTKEQVLEESMIYGYLKHKDELFDMILTDPETGEKLELLEEIHEIYVNGKLKSNLYKEDHDFVGIVDLLLLTNKGFIIIDYKTSSFEPDWSTYLDQIYRYIMLLKSNFPDTPICKVGIINIRKTNIRKKKSENDIEFLRRMKLEYEIDDEKYINYHEFPMKDINENLMIDYINNLSKMADCAESLIDNDLLFINYGAQVGQYGKSEFYDIIYNTKDAYVLYQINDKIWNETTNKFDNVRDCLPIDMMVIKHKNCMNHYSLFKKRADMYFGNDVKISDKDIFFEHLKQQFIYNEELLDKYWVTYLIENDK